MERLNENIEENSFDFNHLIFECIARNDLRNLEQLLSLDGNAIECLDDFSNTPLLYACYCGRHRAVNYLLAKNADYKRINIFGKPLFRMFLFFCFWVWTLFKFLHFQYSGQNALTLATYSGDRKTCDIILQTIRFDELNTIGLLSPLCVATLQGNIDLVKIYLAMESSSGNSFECSSGSIHGICPLKLAQIMDNTEMTELLRSKHQTHLPI